MTLWALCSRPPAPPFLSPGSQSAVPPDATTSTLAHYQVSSLPSASTCFSPNSWQQSVISVPCNAASARDTERQWIFPSCLNKTEVRFMKQESCRHRLSGHGHNDLWEIWNKVSPVLSGAYYVQTVAEQQLREGETRQRPINSCAECRIWCQSRQMYNRELPPSFKLTAWRWAANTDTTTVKGTENNIQQDYLLLSLLPVALRATESQIIGPGLCFKICPR